MQRNHYKVTHLTGLISYMYIDSKTRLKQKHGGMLRTFSSWIY